MSTYYDYDCLLIQKGLQLSKEVGKQYFRVTNDFYLMELTMMKGGARVRLMMKGGAQVRLDLDGIDYDEGWCASETYDEGWCASET